jgi:hypothetical protein
MTTAPDGWDDEDEQLDKDAQFLLSVVSEPENLTTAQKVRAVKQALQIRDDRIIDQARNDVIEEFRKDLTEQAPTLPPSLESPVAEALARFRNPLTTDADAKLLLVTLIYSLALDLISRQSEN